MKKILLSESDIVYRNIFKQSLEKEGNSVVDFQEGENCTSFLLRIIILQR